MLDVARQAVEAARSRRSRLSPTRGSCTDETESLTVRNQEMEGIDRATSEGSAMRVLVTGTGGSPPPPGSTSPRRSTRTAELAVRDREGRRSPPDGDPSSLPGRAGDRHLASTVPEDPFNVPLEEKVALLMEATRRMQIVDGLAFAEGGIDLFRRSTCPRDERGHRDRADLTVQSRRAGSRRRRSATASSSAARSRTRSAATSRPPGWEHIQKLGLIEEAERTAHRGRRAARRRRSARARSRRSCSTRGRWSSRSTSRSGTRSSSTGCSGWRRRTRGPRSSGPRTAAPLRYASPLVSITADASLPGGLGSFGWDDEGVPAQTRADHRRRDVPELHLEPRDRERRRAHVVRGDARGRMGAPTR